MKLSIKAGATSQTINIWIQDKTSTTGAGLTGLVYNTSGLTAYYGLSQAASAVITLATLSAVTSAYSSGGFKEIDSTNMPGWYRFDIPNAAIASGRFSTIHFQGGGNMAPLPIEIELTGWDNQDAVHGGMSALPNTACTTNASLLTSGTGTDQLSVTTGQVNLGKILGTTVSTPATAGVLDVNVKNMNNVAATAITTIKAVQGLTTADTITTCTTVTNQLTAAAIASGVWNDTTAGDFTVSASIGKSVMNGVALGTGLTINGYTGNTPQTGDAYARLGAPAGASTAADIAAINSKTTNLPAAPASTTNITGGTITTVTNLTNAPTAGDFTATMKTSLNAATPASVQNISAQTGDAYVAANAVGTSLAADLVTIDNNIAGVSSQVSGLNNLSSAQVTTACTASTPTAAAVTGAVGSVTAQVSANVTAVNGTTVIGDGGLTQTWGPA